MGVELNHMVIKCDICFKQLLDAKIGDMSHDTSAHFLCDNCHQELTGE